MKKELVRMTLAMLLIIPGVSLFSQETFLLKYNFEKGKSYIQNTRMTQNTVQTFNGQEIKIFSEITAKNGLQVEGTDGEGNATLLITAGDVSVRSSAMGRDTTLSYKDLKDKVRMKLSPSGKSLSTEKVDSSEVAAIVNQLNMGELRFLPGKAVKMGEKWLDQSVNHRKPASGTPFDIEVITDTEYTLAGKETVDGKELLKITYTGSLSMKGKGTQMGMELFMEGTGKNEGFSWFDPVASLIVSTEENMEMEVSVAVSGPQNMTVPSTQSIKTVITMEEKK